MSEREPVDLGYGDLGSGMCRLVMACGGKSYRLEGDSFQSDEMLISAVLCMADYMSRQPEVAKSEAASLRSIDAQEAVSLLRRAGAPLNLWRSKAAATQ